MRLRALSVFLLAILPLTTRAVDLLERYPTTLTAGDASAERARAWDFTTTDVFHISRFDLAAAKDLQIQTGPADLGIGHCADGAVWALVLPRTSGSLVSKATGRGEAVAHVWLRFHPGEIGRLFPTETVTADGPATLTSRMLFVARAKMPASWQAGGKALIPEPKDLTIDVDTRGRVRRVFLVDQRAGTVEYVDAFEERAVRLPPPITPALAEEAFDQLWQAFDRDYAMFVLRPEVDWAKLRDRYRPLARQCQTTEEFSALCAEMLRNLRDLHIWLKASGMNVPVFNRPRISNANPSAHSAILGTLREAGPRVKWTVTPGKIGYLAVYGWNDSSVAGQCDKALEGMRDTRGLIVDVRLNGGGDEPTAGQFAGRFLQKEYAYSYSRYRNGPAHTDLTGKRARTVQPRGPWRYDRPVVLLIGQLCMSSNESFIAMMEGSPTVTTMGDRTCGSSGNPKTVSLPLDLTVNVPRWIDYLQDGQPLDERGIQPRIPFTPTAGAFEGNRDDLLTAALERLRSAPLPGKPN